MDGNRNHFPTLLIICLLMSIIFYVASIIVCYLHERKNTLNARASVTQGVPLSPEGLHEEEQQSPNILRDLEDK